MRGYAEDIERIIEDRFAAGDDDLFERAGPVEDGHRVCSQRRRTLAVGDDDHDAVGYRNARRRGECLISLER